MCISWNLSRRAAAQDHATISRESLNRRCYLFRVLNFNADRRASPRCNTRFENHNLPPPQNTLTKHDEIGLWPTGPTQEFTQKLPGGAVGVAQRNLNQTCANKGNRQGAPCQNYERHRNSLNLNEPETLRPRGGRY